MPNTSKSQPQLLFARHDLFGFLVPVVFFDPDIVPEPPFNGGLLGFLQPLLEASLHLGEILPSIHPIVEELQA